MTASPDSPCVFAAAPLDRGSDRRGDAAFLNERRARADSFFVPLWRLQPFVMAPAPGSRNAAPEAGFFRPGLVETLSADAPQVFLGLDAKDRAYFAVDLSALPDPCEGGRLAGLGSFRDLRAIAGAIDAGDAAILAQAKALLDWHARHRFCASCGAPTAMAEAGYRRDCGACGAQHFPRTDPVVIMLAVRGARCLVGRGPQFPPGMFSALAGFVEPGETLEQAVRRELHEETGIRAGAVRYVFSQPWPFPSSLMIGCIAEAENEDLQLDPKEVVEAHWLSRETVRAILAGQGPDGIALPPPVAIAHHLARVFAEDA